MRRLPLVLVATSLLVLATAALAADPAGFFTQLPGPAGCITDNGQSNAAASDCAVGRGLLGAEALALSPDGRFAYVSSWSSNRLAVVDRDTTTSALSQRAGTDACIATTSVGGQCTDGRLPSGGSDSAHAIALSGGQLFEAGGSGDRIARFTRNETTGALTEPAGQSACVSQTGTDGDGTGGGCLTDPRLESPNAIAVSPDGKFLYAGNNAPTGLTVYSIDSGGALAPVAGAAGCYAAGVVSGCTQARLARYFFDVALSPDGTTLYATNILDNAVVAFRRDAITGALTEISGPAGCVFDDGVGDGTDPCVAGRALGTAQSVEVSPDGKLLSVSGAADKGIAILHRAPDGSLSQSAGAAGCVTEGATSGCGASRVTQNVYRTLFTPDSGTLISAGYGDTPAGSGISVFDVAADGTLTQRVGTHGCISDSGMSGTCTAARGVLGPVGLALTSDAKWLYATGYEDAGVAAFRLRHPAACSDASGSTAFGTPVTITVACTDTVALTGVDGPAHGTVSFSGLNATYTPAAGFSGADSFRVKGTDDGAGESAPATVSVTVGAGPPGAGPGGSTPVVGKVVPLGLSITAKPKRDRKLPYVFRFSGKLKPATGKACSGKVVLTVKRGTKRVARKRVTLSSACAWKATVRFKNRKKLGKRRGGTLKAKARYGGNTVMTAKSSKTIKVRWGR